TKTIFYITLNIYPSFLNVLNHLVTYIYFPTTRGRSPPLKLQYFIEDQWGHTRTNSQTSSSYRFFTISPQTFHHWGALDLSKQTKTIFYMTLNNYPLFLMRSAERRVGTECRSRW